MTLSELMSLQLAESSLYRACTLGASLLVVGQWGGVEVNVRDSERAFNMIERYVELADEDNEGTMVVKAGIHSQVTNSIGDTVQAQIGWKSEGSPVYTYTDSSILRGPNTLCKGLHAWGASCSRGARSSTASSEIPAQRQICLRSSATLSLSGAMPTQSRPLTWLHQTCEGIRN